MWATVEAAAAVATAARQRADEAVEKNETDRQRGVTVAFVQYGKEYRRSLNAAQDSIDLVDRLGEAYDRFLASRTAEHGDLVDKLKGQVKADPLANLEYGARVAEQKWVKAEAVAQEKAQAAEQAIEILNRAKRRLARRAAAARRRRAFAAGVEPEPEVAVATKEDTPRAVYSPWHALAGQEIPE